MNSFYFLQWMELINETFRYDVLNNELYKKQILLLKLN